MNDKDDDQNLRELPEPLPGQTISERNMAHWVACISKAPTDEFAERFLRIRLEGFAKKAPMHVIVAMANATVEVRKAEMRGDAERN